MFKLKNLSIGYQQPIAQDLNLHIGKQQIVALLGANGCGKTTLLKTLLGLIPPLQGEILIENRPHFAWQKHELAQRIGYVPQGQQKQFGFSVLEMVLMGRTAYLPWFATPKQVDKNIALQALMQLGVAHLASKPYHALSGGERQLVLIARALAQQTKCLLMDEPTSNLDFGNQVMLLEQIQCLRQQGLTVLFTTHQPEQAYRYANHVILFHQGKILAQGNPEEVMTLSHLANIYHLPEQVLQKNLHLKRE